MPGARFDDEVTLLLKRAHHRRRHFNLARPVFVFRMSLGDQAFRPKDFLHEMSTLICASRFGKHRAQDFFEKHLSRFRDKVRRVCRVNPLPKSPKRQLSFTPGFSPVISRGRD